MNERFIITEPVRQLGQTHYTIEHIKKLRGTTMSTYNTVPYYTIDSYIDRMIKLAKQYNLKLTFRIKGI